MSAFSFRRTTPSAPPHTPAPNSVDMLRVRCSTCGAPPGERCAPRTVLIGYHLARLLAAGGRPAVR